MIFKIFGAMIECIGWLIALIVAAVLIPIELFCYTIKLFCGMK